MAPSRMQSWSNCIHVLRDQGVTWSDCCPKFGGLFTGANVPALVHGLRRQTVLLDRFICASSCIVSSTFSFGALLLCHVRFQQHVSCIIIPVGRFLYQTVMIEVLCSNSCVFTNYAYSLLIVSTIEHIPMRLGQQHPYIPIKFNHSCLPRATDNTQSTYSPSFFESLSTSLSETPFSGSSLI